MATIIQRGKKTVTYNVVYYGTSRGGVKKQIWEPFKSEAEAKKRKLEVELLEAQNLLFIPSNAKFEDYFNDEYVPTYGRMKWKHSTYTTNIGMFKNHILPCFGHMKMSEIKPHDVEKFISDLSMKKGLRNGPNENSDFLSSSTVHYIYILLKKALSKAVEWEIISTSPVLCSPPAVVNDERAIWEPETFTLALEEMQGDALLHLAVHLAFKATLRSGETVALTWDCVDFDNCRIVINKELQRISKEALQKLPKKDILYVYPEIVPTSKSVLVLKKPKTKKSLRTNSISRELRDELLERKKQMEREKEFYGADYQDNNLVICYENGRPVEPKRCSRWFNKWQKKTTLGLDKIVFHGIRHSSTSYKLVLSQGDFKTVQEDLGDSSANMVTDVYSHVLKSRKNALSDKFDREFYGEQTENVDKPADDDQLQKLFAEKISEDPKFLAKILIALGASSTGNPGS